MREKLVHQDTPFTIVYSRVMSSTEIDPWKLSHVKKVSFLKKLKSSSFDIHYPISLSS